MRVVVVSHFHWDREWYRTFEAYRARLADAVDRVLVLLEADPDYRFVLDGQAVLLEDYLAVRPSHREALVRGLRAGRLAAGPWYVQPDALLPSAEAHVRNLLLGRAAVAALGAEASRVGYLPDSFGHPAQLPQLLAGFGMRTFVHWRGIGDELVDGETRYRWQAPDGTAVDVLLLRDGYFDAAALPADPEEAAERLAEIVARRHDDPVVLMNGFDHELPDAHVGAVAEALARRLGQPVVRGLLEDAEGGEPARTVQGELVGAKLANLLPGVWSSRLPLKLANRRCEALLEGWAEPWAALGRVVGVPDERPALDLAWRAVVQSQAHDSIGGCGLDAVADATAARYAAAEGLAGETVTRVLERLAGLGPERRVPWTRDVDVVVFNPSPHVRTDVVHVPLDAYPALRLPLGHPEFAPLVVAAAEGAGWAVAGRPVRVVASDDPTRTRWLPGQPALDAELVVDDVPPFGCRRLRLSPAEPVPDVEDEGRVIAWDDAEVEVADDGTLAVRLTDRRWAGLLGLEDRGDRGDTYDFDALDDDPGATLVDVACRRLRHASGLQRLLVRRTYAVPAGLAPSRRRRDEATTPLVLDIEVRLAHAVRRVDLAVTVTTQARDHRVRLCFPTGAPADTFLAATTGDVVRRPTGPATVRGWMHRAPHTFAHHGWMALNGLTVVAPGLPEGEVAPDGTVYVTLRRAVGWLARFDLRSRPSPAGPQMPVAGAQLPGSIAARLALLAGADAAAARDAELGLRGVVGGGAPLLDDHASLLSLEPAGLVLSAVKPVVAGDGLVVRVLNPTDAPLEAVLRFGFPLRTAVAVRLDESPSDEPVQTDARRISFAVPPHALRGVLVRT